MLLSVPLPKQVSLPVIITVIRKFAEGQNEREVVVAHGGDEAFAATASTNILAACPSFVSHRGAAGASEQKPTVLLSLLTH